MKQFDAFEPLPGLRINGMTTLGENLANMAEFFEAFGCKDGDAMKRPEQVRPSVW